jgi:hypothetical protein
MATLVLSAAGAALGGSFGGSLAGLSSLALGRAAGAILGNSIDQMVLGQGSAPVETGRVDQFRVMGASEGTALPRVFGRVRLGGHLIWSSRFLETVNEENVGGKGGGGAAVRNYSYSISVAVALCEGEVIRVGRIWADGQPLDQSDLSWRLHRGGEGQLPDPLIAAIEGAGAAPAYRGTAYVVIENLGLAPFGNRIPQFSFEVFRRADADEAVTGRHPALDVRGVALVPGTGEYALATEPVRFERGKGEGIVTNVHNDRGMPDILASMDQLEAELPAAKAVSLVVTWFGDDLRCDRCTLRPAVEQDVEDGAPMPWRVAGLSRWTAPMVSRVDGRPVFGGTPADASVVQIIEHMNASGQRVMFYPFVLMDILAGNGLRDPWSGAGDQPVIPWRGRITLSRAPGTAGSVDKSSAAADEVAAFFGSARREDFNVSGDTVSYSGPDGWTYRRFILHYAHLCARAGGVAAFCIGSELRGLTQIRDGATSYPAVRALRALAEDVRAILGPETKIGYAADWSEYFGHRPGDGSGDVLFNLDPLWADPHIDFVGIDNYMPLSDWRDGSGHADAVHGSIYDLGYLTGNVAGGEGYDWYYADDAGRQSQHRIPIVDTAHGEHWVFRYKDLVNWWSRLHLERPGGVRAAQATEWVPCSKPIWFTELGCPAVDKGTNQPNVFHDPKSSESFFPYFSNGSKDEYIQFRYLQAVLGHWAEPENNPVSPVYGGPMVDMANAYVWAWDARPWPDFPDRLETWVDGTNYELGHWINGRATSSSLAGIVGEVCKRSGLRDPGLSTLHGLVTGYAIQSVEDARQSLQPLMLAYGFDSFGRDGTVAFASRGGRVARAIGRDDCVALGGEPVLVRTRAPGGETPGRVLFGYVRSDMDYASGAATALRPDAAEPGTAQSSLPIVLDTVHADAIAARWLAEGELARDTISFALPPSYLAVLPGDVMAVRLDEAADLFRVDRVDELGHRQVKATRIEPDLYVAPLRGARRARARAIAAETPAFAVFLDLPLLTGDEVAHAPHVAVAKRPWTGPMAVYSAADDYDYVLNREMRRPAVIGETLEPVPAGDSGRWLNSGFRLRIGSGVLQSRSSADVLNGANVAALRFGDSGNWEVIQFRDAVLEAPRVYRLWGLLRGQAGTDGVAPETWPAGTDFVLLDGAPRQLDLASSTRGLERHFRIGPASRPHDAPSYIHRVEAFAGVGLRPYRPAHLRARRRGDGDIEITWVRRTRVDGDLWASGDVPLAEARELYHVRILEVDRTLREFSSDRPAQIYSAADQLRDGEPSNLIIEVAQVSERFGSGPYERIAFYG